MGLLMISRRIRSYVRREGRMTQAQRQGLLHGWPQFGVDDVEKLQDLSSIFGRKSVCNMEIGFGMGGQLLAAAVAYPRQNFLGVEVYRPGVGAVLCQLIQKGLSNIRLVAQDSVDVVEYGLKEATLDRIIILFPDPWPKKKHHKRRLIQVDFAKQLAKKLKPGGLLMMTTDDDDYACHMVDVMEAVPAWDRVDDAPDDGVFKMWSSTKYQRRAEVLGHNIHRFYFRCLNRGVF